MAFRICVVPSETINHYSDTMRISYWKIGIYVLTFVTYAYSGYGSSTIRTLRDSLIAAEAVFEDVFKNAIYLAKKFRTMSEVFDAAAGSDDKCTFRCLTSKKRTPPLIPINSPAFPDPDRPPLRNKHYTPSSNGCGIAGMKISREYLPTVEMEHCCNEHDLCYDTCNNDKVMCDLDFRRCLLKICDKVTGYGEIALKGKKWL